MTQIRNSLLKLIINLPFVQKVCNKIGISPQVLISGLAILFVILLQTFLPKIQNKLDPQIQNKKEQEITNQKKATIPNVSQGKNAQGNTYHVTKVSDGDTINVTTALGDILRVRFAFIDAPEKAQEFGQECRSTLEKKLLDQDVNLEVKETDQYGRQVAEVFFDGKSVNLEALQSGCAWHYSQYHPKGDKNYGLFSAAQQTAQEKHIGLWSLANPQNPSDFRKAAKRQGL
jgi:endonuclease YncB( thermonuclease family)